MLFFFKLMIILFVTKIAGDISVRLGQPAVLGKLLVGILVGPAVLGWIHDNQLIQETSTIGVLLLMFIAGLETDLHQLNKNLHSSVAVAVGGIIIPFLGGYGGGLFFGMDTYHAIFLGLLLSATSVSISVQTLKELNQLNSREGTTILGAALIDDILVVITLAVMMGFLTSSDISIGMVIGKKILFFILVIFIGWKIVPWFIRCFAKLKVTETVLSAALIICFFFAYMAEYFDVAGIIGAFAAGIAISQTKFRKEVEKKTQLIAYSLFVPVFFVSIGLSVSFQGIGDHLWFIVVLTIIAVLTKWLGSGMGARLTGFNTSSSLAVGAGMVSRGEVALIIAAMGLETHLLDQIYFTSVIIVIIATTIVTPPLLKWCFRREEKQ